MDIFKQISIVMEAEDITGQVKEDMTELGSDNNTDTDNRDIGKTDNIFGTEGNDEGPDDDDGEGGDDTLPDGDSEEGSDNPENLGSGGEGNEDDNDIEVVRKKKLRDNMILFHDILTSNIKLLSDYRPTQSTPESSKILFNVTSNLQDCKTILFREITESFQTKSYTSLLKTYVALNRVYELCQETLEKYFENINLQSNRSNKKYSKQKL